MYKNVSFPVKDIYGCKVEVAGESGVMKCRVQMRFDQDRYSLCGEQRTDGPGYNAPVVSSRLINQFLLGTVTPIGVKIGYGLAVETVARTLHGPFDYKSLCGKEMQVARPLPLAGAKQIFDLYCGIGVSIANFVGKSVLAMGFKLTLPVVCELQYTNVPCPTITYAHNGGVTEYQATDKSVAAPIEALITVLTLTLISELFSVIWFDHVGFCMKRIQPGGPIDRYVACIAALLNVPEVPELLPPATLGAKVVYGIVNAFPSASVVGVVGVLINRAIFLSPASCTYDMLPPCIGPKGCNITIAFADGGYRELTIGEGAVYNQSELGEYKADSEIAGSDLATSAALLFG